MAEDADDRTDDWKKRLIELYDEQLSEVERPAEAKERKESLASLKVLTDVLVTWGIIQKGGAGNDEDPAEKWGSLGAWTESLIDRQAKELEAP